ncbi:MAG: DUF4388 domain-containing protein, partial [Thermodesulfobacteriota bacterium]
FRAGAWRHHPHSAPVTEEITCGVAGMTSQTLQRSSEDKPPEDVSEVIDYSSYDLPTTIHLIVSGGESRRIDVRKGSRSGSIYIKAGEIYCAETSEGSGDEGYFAILSWEDAVHTDVPETVVPERNIRIPTDVLLEMLSSSK